MTEQIHALEGSCEVLLSRKTSYIISESEVETMQKNPHWFDFKKHLTGALDMQSKCLSEQALVMTDILTNDEDLSKEVPVRLKEWKAIDTEQEDSLKELQTNIDINEPHEYLGFVLDRANQYRAHAEAKMKWMIRLHELYPGAFLSPTEPTSAQLEYVRRHRIRRDRVWRLRSALCDQQYAFHGMLSVLRLQHQALNLRLDAIPRIDHLIRETGVTMLGLKVALELYEKSNRDDNFVQKNSLQDK